MSTSAKFRIIGVSGTNGSGKDTIAAMLAKQYGFLNASATEMFLGELRSRNWPIDRKHKAMLSAEWRREFGMGVIVDKAVELFKKSQTQYEGIVVGSLRHPGEADRVHELGGTMIWIDADPKIRYDRIQGNLAERQGTHEEENLTFEEFLSQETREMQHVGDGATLNMSAVKERADLVLLNDKDLESFLVTAIRELGL